MDKSAIEWCGPTWNPWYGCVKKRRECARCYIYREMPRYGKDPAVVKRAAPGTFERPLKWAREVERGQRSGLGRYAFTCSWSDFFNVEADPWRPAAWELMRRTWPEMRYMVLTKEVGRVERQLPADWGAGYPGVWLGVTVGIRDARGDLDVLRRIPAQLRFVSFEPLLEDLGDLDLAGIGWGIVGGESDRSGPTPARSFDLRHGEAVMKQLVAAGIPRFFKQAGTRPVVDGVQVPTESWKGHDIAELPLGFDYTRRWPREVFDDACC